MRIRALVVMSITLVTVGCSDEAALPDATLVDDAPNVDADETAIDAADAPGPDAPVDTAGPDGPPLAALDPTFGTEGWRSFDGFFMDVAQQPDGRIVVGAYEPPVPPGTAYTPLVLRYLPDGTLDPTFGQGGVVRHPMIDTIWSIAVLTDGRIVVGGNGFGGLIVLSSTGFVLTVTDIPTGNAKDVLPMPDGGFTVGLETVQMVGTGYVFGVSMGRWDSAIHRVASFGANGVTEMQPPQSFATVKWLRLARVTTGGVERVVMAYDQGVRGVVAATGVLDGSFAAAGGGTTDVVPIAVQNDRVVVARRRLEPGIDTTEVQPVTPSGAGAATPVAYCSFTTDTRPMGLVIDSAQRAIVAPFGDASPTVRLARLEPTLAGPDPAWGCGRTFTLPEYCPTGLPCPGSPPMEGMRVLDLLVTSSDAIVVVGNQSRIGTSRAFLARVLP